MGQSGMEMMLRSMGMGDALDAAKALATDGTIQKIIKFADDTDALLAEMRKTNERLERIENALAALQSGSGGRDCGPIPTELRQVSSG